MRLAMFGAGLLIVLASLSTGVIAGLSQVPEISGGAVTTGLGLLAGGILMLRARLGRK